MSPQSDRGRSAREQQQIERSMARWTMWVAVFTGLLFVASLISNMFIYFQYRTSIDVQRETREQSRAVISMSQAAIVLPDDLSKPGAAMVVVPTFQNFGTTRTDHFSATASLKLFEGGIPNNLDLSKPYLDVKSSSVIIAPSSNYQGLQVAIPGADVQKAKDGLGDILYWSSAEYSDIFEPKKIHHLTSCTLLRPTTGPDGKMVIQPIPFRPSCNQSD